MQLSVVFSALLFLSILSIPVKCQPGGGHERRGRHERPLPSYNVYDTHERPTAPFLSELAPSRPSEQHQSRPSEQHQSRPSEQHHYRLYEHGAEYARGFDQGFREGAKHEYGLYNEVRMAPLRPSARYQSLGTPSEPHQSLGTPSEPQRPSTPHAPRGAPHAPRERPPPTAERFPPTTGFITQAHQARSQYGLNFGVSKYQFPSLDDHFKNLNDALEKTNNEDGAMAALMGISQYAADPANLPKIRQQFTKLGMSDLENMNQILGKFFDNAEETDTSLTNHLDDIAYAIGEAIKIKQEDEQISRRPNKPRRRNKQNTRSSSSSSDEEKNTRSSSSSSEEEIKYPPKRSGGENTRDAKKKLDQLLEELKNAEVTPTASREKRGSKSHKKHSSRGREGKY